MQLGSFPDKAEYIWAISSTTSDISIGNGRLAILGVKHSRSLLASCQVKGQQIQNAK